MIEFLEGKLVDKSPTHLVLNVNGVGYGLDVSVSTSLEYQKLNDTVSIFTYLHVKEDSLTLFGFHTTQERSVFLALIGISGIGPKMSQRILSEASPSQLATIVSSDDIVALNKFKGVGKKTASLLMLHLKSSFEKLELLNDVSAIKSTNTEAVMALIALGVKEASAKKAVDSAVKSLGPDASIQKLITEGLKKV